jgi:hypothetical protein
MAKATKQAKNAAKRKTVREVNAAELGGVSGGHRGGLPSKGFPSPGGLPGVTGPSVPVPSTTGPVFGGPQGQTPQVPPTGRPGFVTGRPLIVKGESRVAPHCVRSGWT